MNRLQSVSGAIGFPDAARRYDGLAVFFHWSVFLLIAAAYAAIELKGFAGKGTPARALAMAVHEWTGALVLVLAVPRVLWRLVRGAPPAEPGPRWMQRVGEAMHWVLYLFIVAQPSSACLRSMPADMRWWCQCSVSRCRCWSARTRP